MFLVRAWEVYNAMIYPIKYLCILRCESLQKHFLHLCNVSVRQTLWSLLTIHSAQVLVHLRHSKSFSEYGFSGVWCDGTSGWRPSRTHCTDKASYLCVFSDAGPGLRTEKRPSHIHCSHRVSHPCGSSHARLETNSERRLSHIHCIHTAYHLNEFSRAQWVMFAERRPFRTRCTHMVSLRCGCSDALSGTSSGRTLFHTHYT